MTRLVLGLLFVLGPPAGLVAAVAGGKRAAPVAVTSTAVPNPAGDGYLLSVAVVPEVACRGLELRLAPHRHVAEPVALISIAFPAVAAGDAVDYVELPVRLAAGQDWGLLAATVSLEPVADLPPQIPRVARTTLAVGEIPAPVAQPDDAVPPPDRRLPARLRED